jgi:hypothetical protein
MGQTSLGDKWQPMLHVCLFANMCHNLLPPLVDFPQASSTTHEHAYFLYGDGGNTINFLLYGGGRSLLMSDNNALG